MGQSLAPPAPAATAHPDDKQAQQRRQVQDGADSMSTLVKEAGGLMPVGVSVWQHWEQSNALQCQRTPTGKVKPLVTQATVDRIRCDIH